MRFISRRAFPAFMVVFVMSAIGSSSAFAATLPEFSVAPGAVKGTLGGSTFTAFGAARKYTKGTFTAEGTSKAQLTGAILSMYEGGRNNCINSEHNGFVTKTLKARLGYLSKPTKEVGLMLVPTAEPFGTCEKFLGEESNWQYKGVVTAEIEPVNKKTKIFFLQLRAAFEKQEFLYFEGEKESAEVFPLKLGPPTKGTGSAATVEVANFKLETQNETEIVG